MNSKLGEIICKIRASDYEVNTTQHTWAENLNFLPTKVNNLFKFCARDSDLKYFFITVSSFLTKKVPLYAYYICTNYTVAYKLQLA